MGKWSRESYLIMGVVILLIGLQFIAVEQVVLTRETTVFVARQTNHPQLAAAQSLEQLTGSNSHIVPLKVNVWEWFGKIVALAGVVLIIRNTGKN